MRKFLLASAAGAFLTLPAICGASTVTFESAGSQYQLLFNPSGYTPSNLPSTSFYRSYNCKIGGIVTYPTVIFTPPPPPPTNNNNNAPKGNNTPPSNTQNNPPYTPPSNTPGGNNPPGNNPPSTDGPTPPGNPDPGTPHGCDPAAVPAPNSAAMAGLGLGGLAIFAWRRNRRQARA